MTSQVPFENAVDLLDNDHKLVKSMFIAYGALVQDGAPGDARLQLARKICAALTVHARIEEEIFYPAVREAIGDDALMDEALEQHAQAKEMIASILDMAAGDEALDDTVASLGEAIDEHVLEEREQIFLRAQLAALDLRALAVPLFQRQQALKAEPPPGARAARASASTGRSASTKAARGKKVAA